MSPDLVTEAWHCNLCGRLYYTSKQAKECEGKCYEVCEEFSKQKVLEILDLIDIPTWRINQILKENYPEDNFDLKINLKKVMDITLGVTIAIKEIKKKIKGANKEEYK